MALIPPPADHSMQWSQPAVCQYQIVPVVPAPLVVWCQPMLVHSIVPMQQSTPTGTPYQPVQQSTPIETPSQPPPARRKQLRKLTQQLRKQIKKGFAREALHIMKGQVWPLSTDSEGTWAVQEVLKVAQKKGMQKDL
eukprot:1844938-Amphidinium_carterae.1